MQQIEKLPNVEIYPSSSMNESDILDFGAQQVVLATGSKWRTDGIGREHTKPICGWDSENVFSPDAVMDQIPFEGTVVVYDDDHFYMGGVIAEHLVSKGARVIFITPAESVSYWTQYTLEQRFISQRLMEIGVDIRVNTDLISISEGDVTSRCSLSGQSESTDCDSVILVTGRQANNHLHAQMRARLTEAESHGVVSVDCIGDCKVPGTIAAAVYSGHSFARQLGEPEDARDVPFRVERAVVHED